MPRRPDVRTCLSTVILLTLAFSGGTSWSQSVDPLSPTELRSRRAELAHRARRIIMNNDGCDVLYFPKNERVTRDGLLAKRTAPLAGTQVDSIAFCSTSSGFSYFTHDTRAGTVLTRSGHEFGIQPDSRNIAQDLIEQGTDCLQTVLDFGHKHAMEVFWSMRMNDTHDAAHHPDRPYFLFPPLKQQHPDWLVGEPVKRTPFGRWSSVDYARPEIRDLAYRFIEEVCQNYDLDGVELDFFRHLCYFKSTATGGVASESERQHLTDLMCRIRAMTERIGAARRRPLLIAIRVPDSVDYCRDIGIDLERWMKDGIIDRLITTGYFRLNPWKYSVDLGHSHGIPVYPCLSDSRVRGETRFRRSSVESYRGRAMNAWAAGADGLHLFNFFDPRSSIWREIGDPKTLSTLDKLYFVTVRDGDPRSFLANGRSARRQPVFTPSHPRLLTAAQPAVFEVMIGDDPAAMQSSRPPSVTLHLEMPDVTQLDRLIVKMNGKTLANGSINNGWLDYSVPFTSVQQGANQVTVTLKRPAVAPPEWSIVYGGSSIPGGGWNRDPGSARATAQVDSNGLLIADEGEASGDYLYYRYPWGAAPDGNAVVEACVKTRSGSSFLIVSNGESGERLELRPDRISLYHHGEYQYSMNTADDFHLYRIELHARDLKAYVDGTLRIDAPGILKPRGGYARNEVAFGAANSPMAGQAWWREVKARASGTVCRDLAIRVSH